MTRTPLVTVLIPCRGRPALLARALRALQAQSEPRWRALVIDDASPEPLSPAVGALGDARIDWLRLPRNLGPGGAREAGLARAETPYVALLDSDDVWGPDWLARQLEGAGPDRVRVCAGEVAGPGGARRRPGRGTRPGERIAAFLYIANEFAQASGVLAPTPLARAARFGGLRQYEDHLFLIRAEALGARVEARAEPLYAQTADAGAERAGARDDPARAAAFLEVAGPLMTAEERLAFALRCVGPGLAARDRGAALALAARGAARPRLAGAAARLALRAAAGGGAYEAARRGARAWRARRSA